MNNLDDPPDGIPEHCPEADEDSEAEDEGYHESESEDVDDENEETDTEEPPPPWWRQTIRDLHGNLRQIVDPSRRLRQYYTGTAPNETLYWAIIVEHLFADNSVNEVVEVEFHYDTDPAHAPVNDRSTSLYCPTLRRIQYWEDGSEVREQTFGPPIEVAATGRLRDYPTLLTSWDCIDPCTVHHDEIFGAKRIKVYPDGNKTIYDGMPGQEHIVEMRNETYQYTRYFEGPKDQESCTMIKYDDGRGKYYRGPKNSEHLYKMDWPSGTYQLLEGPKGEEQVYYVKYAVTNVSETWYERTFVGPRMTRMKMRNGTMKYFEGAKGEERLVAKHVPGQGKILYTGRKGRERPMTREEIEAMQLEGTGGMYRTLRRSERVREARGRAAPY